MATRKSPAEREADEMQDAIDSALDDLRAGKLSKAIATLADFESEEEEEEEEEPEEEDEDE